MSHDHLSNAKESIDATNQANLEAIRELNKNGFYVKRNARDGRAEMYEQGWTMTGMHIGNDGYYRLELSDSKGNKKASVPLDMLLSWQPENQPDVSGDTIPRSELVGFIETPVQSQHEVEGEELASDEEVGHAALDAVDIEEPVAIEDHAEFEEEVDSSHEQEIGLVKESVERMLSGISETMPRVMDQVKGLNHLLDAVMTQIHHGMSNDEWSLQAINRYAAEVESINTALNSMLSQVNTLKYKAEGLGFNAFEKGSAAAAAQAKLIEACDTMAKFMHGAYDVLILMREFANAPDTDYAQAASEGLRRAGTDGTMEHLAFNQKELVRALTE